LLASGETKPQSDMALAGAGVADRDDVLAAYFPQSLVRACRMASCQAESVTAKICTAKVNRPQSLRPTFPMRDMEGSYGSQDRLARSSAATFRPPRYLPAGRDLHARQRAHSMRCA